MADTIYTTTANDMLDRIAYVHFGTRHVEGALQLIYEANRDQALADQPPLLPAGLAIRLPEPPALPPTYSPFVLWG